MTLTATVPALGISRVRAGPDHRKSCLSAPLAFTKVHLDPTARIVSGLSARGHKSPSQSRGENEDRGPATIHLQSQNKSFPARNRLDQPGRPSLSRMLTRATRKMKGIFKALPGPIIPDKFTLFYHLLNMTFN